MFVAFTFALLSDDCLSLNNSIRDSPAIPEYQHQPGYGHAPRRPSWQRGEIEKKSHCIPQPAGVVLMHDDKVDAGEPVEYLCGEAEVAHQREQDLAESETSAHGFVVLPWRSQPGSE